MNLLFDAIQWYLVASGVASSLVLIGGWLWQRGQRPTHAHAVYGPFRPNVRRIMCAFLFILPYGFVCEPAWAAETPVHHSLMCYHDELKGWEHCADGVDMDTILHNSTLPATSPTICSYDGRLPIPKMDALTGLPYRQIPPCVLPFAYVYHPETDLWDRATEPRCLATMEAAMKAMEPHWNRSYRLPPLTGPAHDRFIQAMARWEAAKACWSRP